MPTSTRSVLTLNPLPKIDPKAKGKGMIEEEDESDTESEDIIEAEKKFKMLANDEDMARKVQEKWEAEEKKERLAEEEATKAAFTNEENFTIDERSKLLHDTIAAQRRFLVQQRSEVIRNKLPSRTQLRNQMITYLKHVGGKKHSDLKTKNFEEIQVLYEKADSINEESKEEEGTKKRKLGTRKKRKSRKRRFRQVTSEDDETNSEKENDELRLCLTIAPNEDKEVDYEILDKKYPITEWKSEYLGIKPQDDLCVVYQLVMDKYQDEIPEDFDKVLWGDLMIMFNPSDEDEFRNSQQDWNVYSLRKKVLLQMLKLKLESEEDSTMALE
ncbi:hypothetical protein Tco_1162118 [Tanacetum coccineum]